MLLLLLLVVHSHTHTPPSFPNIKKKQSLFCWDPQSCHFFNGAFIVINTQENGDWWNVPKNIYCPSISAQGWWSAPTLIMNYYTINNVIVLMDTKVSIQSSKLKSLPLISSQHNKLYLFKRKLLTNDLKKLTFSHTIEVK